MGSSGGKRSVNRNAVIVFVVLVLAAIVFYTLRQRASTQVQRLETGSFSDQQEVDVISLPAVPMVTEEELSTYKSNGVYTELEVNGKKMTIYGVHMLPQTPHPQHTVLLLHGMHTTSQKWLQFNTLHRIAHWGFRAIALDMPGYGESKDVKVEDSSKGDFVEALTRALQLSRPIIMASSHGCTFALPYLFSTPSGGEQRATAFVGEACGGSEKYVDNYPQSQLRALILYGDKDQRIGAVSRRRLQHLPRSHIVVLPGASHGPLGQKPELYHRALYHYLRYITTSS